jgi:hypothetical protein
MNCDQASVIHATSSSSYGTNQAIQTHDDVDKLLVGL